MSVQVIMSPTLKCCTWVIRMMAIDFNHLVEYASCVSKELIAKVVS